MGIGLFLGLVFCGVIYLYTQTKDRWNWGKGGKIFLYLIGTPFALFLIFLSGNYLYDEYQYRPKVISEFKGIQLGEKLQDVIFKHGEAVREQTRSAEYLARYIVEIKDKKGTPEFEQYAVAYKNAKDAEAKVIAKGTTDGEYWFGDVLVEINNSKVEYIAYECKSDGYDSMELNGISCGSKGEVILNKFGNDVRVLCSLHKNNNDYLSRAYDIVKYGTRYYLVKNSVFRMAIFPPAILESKVGENWGKCG